MCLFAYDSNFSKKNPFLYLVDSSMLPQVIWHFGEKMKNPKMTQLNLAVILAENIGK